MRTLTPTPYSYIRERFIAVHRQSIEAALPPWYNRATHSNEAAQEVRHGKHKSRLSVLGDAHKLTGLNERKNTAARRNACSGVFL